jgi:hypothetical protein
MTAGEYKSAAFTSPLNDRRLSQAPPPNKGVDSTGKQPTEAYETCLPAQAEPDVKADGATRKGKHHVKSNDDFVP